MASDNSDDGVHHLLCIGTHLDNFANAMNAQEAKALTFRVKPPQRPDDCVIGGIVDYASRGLRRFSVNSKVSEEQQWWLEENGYRLVTVASPNACKKEVLVAIEW